MTIMDRPQTMIIEEPPGIFSGDCSQATPIDGQAPNLICGGLSIKPPGILDGGIVKLMTTV